MSKTELTRETDRMTNSEIKALADRLRALPPEKFRELTLLLEHLEHEESLEQGERDN